MKSKLGDRKIKQLLNLVIFKYRDLSVSRRSITCLIRIIDLLAYDKSRYFAQPRPVIVNFFKLQIRWLHANSKGGSRSISDACNNLQAQTIMKAGLIADCLNF